MPGICRTFKAYSVLYGKFTLTLTEKLCNREIQLKKSLSFTKLAISVQLTRKVLQSIQKLQSLLMHRTSPKIFS